MESLRSQSEPGEEMSFEQRFSQDFNRDGPSGALRQTFGAEKGAPAFSRHRLVIISLGLLNAALLIAAFVIGIYCTKDVHLQGLDSAANPLIHEMNYLRNHSAINRAKAEALAQLAKGRTSHLEQKMEIKQQKAVIDRLQGQIETLLKEKSNLQTRKNTLDESCDRCNAGWMFLKSRCYFFSSRQEQRSKKNWMDSRADCTSRGGDLLVINNLEEQQLINDNFPKLSSSGLWWQNGFWMGLTDRVTEGTWVWINNVTEVETMYWRTGQPTTAGPQSGRCAALFYYSDNMRTWYNGNCQDHQYNWICEKEPSQT